MLCRLYVQGYDARLRGFNHQQVGVKPPPSTGHKWEFPKIEDSPKP